MKDERYYAAYFEHNRISRRGLFRSLFSGGKKAQAESAAELLKRSAARPPFAVAEPLFLKQCNGCSDCISACPYGLIFLNDDKASVEIDFSACDLCGKCAEVCSTGALALNVPPDTGLRPSIDFSCVRQHKQSCLFCETVCKPTALSFDPTTQKMQLDNEKCNGCGECKTACPHNYISLAL
ncbi:ferredoxin-type protein NapF [Mannheimia varigena]|uniref:ferredoxin-type protein NapF n=1 Tax=Mannheimia varigena TaxID=85404 RepID=UPI000DBF3249|nr:ferredoxin-type protein NapF [Mannheimia varigena]AWW34387.1 ferredoxin-type protein NapF [Mannheimia varigena]